MNILQPIENPLAKIVEQASTEVYIVDADSLRFLYVNSASRENLGYSLDDILKMTISDISPQANSKESLRELFNTPSNNNKQIPECILKSTHCRKDGSTYPVELHLQLTDFQNKKAYLAFVHDSTEKQKTLEQLNAVIKGGRIGYWDWNIQTGTYEINDRCLEILGLTKKDSRHHVDYWLTHIHPDDKEAQYAAIKRCIQDDQPYSIEFRMQHEEGHWVWIQGSGSVIARNPITNDALRLCGTHIDITERKQDELQLQKNEDKFRALTENSQDVIIRFDRDHRHLYINSAILQFRDIPIEDYLGRTHQEIGFSKELCEHWNKAIELVFTSGKPALEFFEIDSLKGKVQIDWRVFPEFNSDGEVTSVFSVSRDITLFKKAEEEAQKIQKLESLGVLAGGIAHDFNNILTILFGNIILAKNHLSKDHESYKNLEKAEHAFTRATHLTKQLLTFAKGGDPVKQNTNLEKLIKDSTQFDLSGSNIKLVFEPASSLWMAEVDKGQIQQVFSNLTMNASQAMPDGGYIHISAENINITSYDTIDLEDGRYIRFVFKDEGEGIPSQNIKKIFDPYYSTKDTGNGLGLATVYSIVNKHEGHIGVASQPGKGTTFTIHLPASASALQQQETSYKAPSQNNKNARILLMDDEEMIRSLAKKMLEHCGYSVETACDGEQAIQMYQEAMHEPQPFDCIIMDLTIPGGMGGAEAVQQILKLDSMAKVIVSSGYAADTVIGNYTNSGFKGCIDKPFSFKSLQEEVCRVLNA